MSKSIGPEAQVRRLREVLSRLSEASLRISESLDVDTVLREVVAGACALTGAGIGGITTRDRSGQMLDFVTHGLRPGEHRQLLDLPQGVRLWDYLREVAEPLRVKDLSSHFATLGLPRHALMERSFLGMPVRHQGAPVGLFYLLDKEAGREFTDEDEEIMSLFTSQAGAAIANARKHRDEQRARADLQALIDTAPVGVVVLDAHSGQVLSINQESRRIVGDLGAPGQSAEELLKVVTVYRSDGRETALKEYPLTRILAEAEVVRAEEIVLEIPGGRKITTLINATPIVSDQGEIASVVVTMQDMTPLEEQERHRAEFLSMVSHELKVPLASIKGCAATALRASSVMHLAEAKQFFRIVDTQADHMSELIRDLMDAAQIETGSLSVSPEPVDLEVIVDQAKTMFTSGEYENPVLIDLPLHLPRVRADQQRIVQVVGNLLNNAARHSPESSPIRVEAALKDHLVEVSVEDEGPGIPAERLPYLFRKHARSGRDNSGAGPSLGLAICKGLIEAHGGRIWAEPHQGSQGAGTGLGARFTFTIPTVEEVETGVEVEIISKSARSGHIRKRQPLILVVEDDPQALGHIRGILENAGYHALATGDPDKVRELIEARRPDLVLLDLLLPGRDGIELMQSMPLLAEQPVIFLSVYGRDETIARALEVGAVDYVVKPFSPTELIARIQAALRGQSGPLEPFKVGDLYVDYEKRSVVLEGQQLNLTTTEYEFLRILSINAGKTVTYGQVLKSVWQSRNSDDVRVVRTIAKTLRRKLGDEVKNPRYIFTESRVGYRMARSNMG